MSMIPESHSNWYTGMLWGIYGVFLILVFGLTVFNARNPEKFLDHVLGRITKAGHGTC